MSETESVHEEEAKVGTGEHEDEDKTEKKPDASDEVAHPTEEKEAPVTDDSPVEPEDKLREHDKVQSEDELEYEPLLDETMGETGDEKAEPEAEAIISDVMHNEPTETSEIQAEPNEVFEEPIEPRRKSSDTTNDQKVHDNTTEMRVEEPRPSSPPPPSSPQTESVQTREEPLSWDASTTRVPVNEHRVTFEINQRTPVSHVSASEETTSRENEVFTPGRMVYNAAPSMNFQPSHQMSQLNDQMASVSVNTDYVPPKRANPPQSALYRRKPTTQPSNQTWYVKPNYCIAPQPPPNTSNYTTPREPTEYSNYQPQPAVFAAPPPQPQPAPPPARKISATSPYVGSQVIASETGPSLTVLLRRPTSERHWGFTFYGGSEYGCPPFVNKINNGSLAAQHGMEVGDVIVSICNSLTVGKTQEQLKADILRAGNELDLVLIRRGVDLDKISHIAPQALIVSPQSPPPSSGLQDRQVSFPTASRATRADPVMTRGRSFRSIKTKSIRILEEQLASGQSPSSVIQTKQHFQGARGLPATGMPSTFAQAYGQNPNQGYLGRQATAHEPTGGAGWMPGEVGQPVQYAQPVYAPYEPSHFSDRGPPAQWEQASMGQPSWDTQSYAGQSSGWATPRPAYAQPTIPQQVYPAPAYPNPPYQPGMVYAPSANITIPVHARSQWPNRPA